MSDQTKGMKRIPNSGSVRW